MPTMRILGSFLVWFFLVGPLGPGAAWGKPDTPAPQPTKEFELRDDRAYLGGQPVKLWGIRCNNALMSPAVTERHIRCLDTMVAHGINLISVALQGTNGGFPSVDAGPNGYRSDGTLRPDFANRLEELIREADKRGMVVAIYLLQPRKDQELRDEAAVKRAIEETGRFLTERHLKNVFVNLMHEFSHLERADHEILREPDGPAKKAKLVAWFHATAPDVEAGVCPNHKSGSLVDYPGVQIRFFQEEMPIPAHGFVVNTETHDNDEPGNEGIFNAFHRESMRQDWEQYVSLARGAMIFHSAYGEGVTTATGTGPNPERGGYGTGEKDRGVRFYYVWLRANVGRWQYPKHVKADEATRASR
ncbi:hypothetical protein SAMN05444166_7782 [Singulisphaera sp. GP187]|uniref:hypothetical protein n=1 Tax=Singulisphaera sp. GP187 TaxID=1882752 RepID=UPI00092B7142|nr:hypothetical protein [Singulisphaera sp. GP187]SIO65665.1 hypothetical protein SAMN05444166_7782 [Singulisphaera sp. GP187]